MSISTLPTFEISPCVMTLLLHTSHSPHPFTPGPFMLLNNVVFKEGAWVLDLVFRATMGRVCIFNILICLVFLERLRTWRAIHSNATTVSRLDHLQRSIWGNDVFGPESSEFLQTRVPFTLHSRICPLILLNPNLRSGKHDLYIPPRTLALSRVSIEVSKYT